MESSNIQVYVVSHSVDDIKDIDANDIYTPLFVLVGMGRIILVFSVMIPEITYQIRILPIVSLLVFTGCGKTVLQIS